MFKFCDSPHSGVRNYFVMMPEILLRRENMRRLVIMGISAAVLLAGYSMAQAADAPASTVPSSSAPAEASSTPVVEDKTASTGDATKGAVIFKARCQMCHGAGGDAGNKGGMKAAANFSNLDANIPRIKTLLSSLSEDDHKKIVREGGAKSGVAGAGTAMPKLGLSEADIDDVVAYERSLSAFKK